MKRNNYNRMRREIKLALMYRDTWQSSGKYMPRMDQLVRVAFSMQKREE
ncbi:MAG: hypothetical protein KA341_08365 [Saprospiraceae bacterium]|nr:hypothetical protein [Saprospiraceae bacterium]